MNEANKTQIGGTHYQANAIQPWDYIHANQLGFFEGNIVKYVTRYQRKNGIKDLEKAKHFLEKLIELKRNEEASMKRDSADNQSDNA